MIEYYIHNSTDESSEPTTAQVMLYYLGQKMFDKLNECGSISCGCTTYEARKVLIPSLKTEVPELTFLRDEVNKLRQERREILDHLDDYGRTHPTPAEAVQALQNHYHECRIEREKDRSELAELRRRDEALDEYVHKLTGDEGEDDVFFVLKNYVDGLRAECDRLKTIAFDAQNFADDLEKQRNEYRDYKWHSVDSLESEVKEANEKIAAQWKRIQELERKLFCNEKSAQEHTDIDPDFYKPVLDKRDP